MTVAKNKITATAFCENQDHESTHIAENGGKGREGYKMSSSSAIFRSVEASETRCSRALKPDINSSTNLRGAIESHRRSSSPSTVGENFISIFPFFQTISDSVDLWTGYRTTWAADGGICLSLRGAVGDSFCFLGLKEKREWFRGKSWCLCVKVCVSFALHCVRGRGIPSSAIRSCSLTSFLALRFSLFLSMWKIYWNFFNCIVFWSGKLSWTHTHLSQDLTRLLYRYSCLCFLSFVPWAGGWLIWLGPDSLGGQSKNFFIGEA